MNLPDLSLLSVCSGFCPNTLPSWYALCLAFWMVAVWGCLLAPWVLSFNVEIQYIIGKSKRSLSSSFLSFCSHFPLAYPVTGISPAHPQIEINWQLWAVISEIKTFCQVQRIQGAKFHPGLLLVPSLFPFPLLFSCPSASQIQQKC